ncbi:MAG: DUF2884 domain-containing protein [Dyella sp.]
MPSLRLTLPLLATVLLAGCSYSSDYYSSSELFDGRISVQNGLVTLSAKHAADATIDRTGHLIIDGHPTATNATQQALLLQYYQAVAAVREHGIAAGMAGAAMAGASIIGSVQSMASKDGDDIDQRVNEQSKKIALATMKICEDMVAIRRAQDILAAQLPAFQPYADIADSDADKDCRQHG